MDSMILFQTGTSQVFAVPAHLAAELQEYGRLVAIENRQAFILEARLIPLDLTKKEKDAQG